ncbi:MAG: 3-methyladenine DNA glycosylase [Gammaproteobacteria bacterium]|uniref:Putative 3-methyladenine DNA glycosylase n=1 Tax=OM182 bacterium MED-G24 TaxID=1986255 RepID=A0A2A5WSA4_9GAMM|nr:3-methyladenine DNA glycosylase [Gammaproteobacteria bacterium]PDH39425.1 MAG: 3-methyladenine DNA glycosylase [OM182 bacterium MED-G24]|tara:strand:- start:921 stop:1589 length:669 start_codon:yes stop_codon:yes gene_type:complete
MYALTDKDFHLDAHTLARRLLGTVIRHKPGRTWLAAQIIETEAYFLTDKASHASLGRTPSREPLFMPAGTIYMYYARGGDSLNFSAQGAGNAVLIKSAIPATDHMTATGLRRMITNNPTQRGDARQLEHLCSGQTLLCRALGLEVPKWSGRRLVSGKLELLDPGNAPHAIVQTRRLGIPAGRDPHLPYRFVDQRHVRSATRNPFGRNLQEGIDYRIITGPKN